MLSDLELSNAYDSGGDSVDILNSFYVPVLREAVQYDRLTGYFSPGVIAMAARGIAGLVANGGRMRLVTSPSFHEQELEALRQANDPALIDEILVEKFRMFCSDADLLGDEIRKNHIAALGWLLREGRLEIRVLVPRDPSEKNRLFHSKVGLLYDEAGNCLSFSGSINETVAGWRHNIEEFKVFRSWEEGTSSMVLHDQQLFDRYWEPASNVDFSVFEVPPEAKKLLVERAPEDFSELHLPDQEEAEERVDTPSRLWEYQEKAVESWWNNQQRGILAMATGSGKTKTAVGAIRRFRSHWTSTVCVVTAPYQHIATNWLEELSFAQPISTFSGGSWRTALANGISRLKSGRQSHLMVIAVQNTAAMGDFTEMISSAIDVAEASLFVGDEAHGLGAPGFRQALLPKYLCRLGLTATPERHLDDEGTDFLLEFFGGIVSEFTIADGLSWINPLTGQSPLCEYEYEPVFVGLDDDEVEDWLSITRAIVRLGSQRDQESEEKKKLLLIKRAAIAKSARQKPEVLASLIRQLLPIKHCLIYCSDSEQLGDVLEVLDRLGKITYRKFTGREGTAPRPELGGLSEREHILESFAEGAIEVLVAIKCLDEGVDVPAASTGIILASSKNRREFVQRRGRLLRRSPGKDKARIFDFVVAPKFPQKGDRETASVAAKVIGSELERVVEFAGSAINSVSVGTKVLAKVADLGIDS